jgi:hypothetical protein
LTTEVYNLTIAPGIQRDGTLFDAPCYVDGVWVRFQRGRPRKIWGYKGIFLNAPGVTRGMIMQSQNGENYVYGGYSDSLQYWQTDNDDGVGSGPYPIGFYGSIATDTILNQGSAYTNGTYTNVPLTGGSGTGATANITVSGNKVTSVVIALAGSGYLSTDVLSANSASIGGTGSGFQLGITVLSAFTPNDNNLWQFDITFDSAGSGALTLIAHPGQNLDDIDSTVNTPVLYGNFPGGALSKVGVFTVTGTATGSTITIPSENYLIGVGQTVTGVGIPANTKVTASVVVSTPSPQTTVTISNAVTGSPTSFTFDNNIAVSGGCVMLYPYLFVYGNNGLLKNNSAGDLTNWTGADSNENNVAATKIVKGLPVRGGTTAPAGLFWSLDSLIRVVYNPTTVGTSTIYWTYDLLTNQTSILSSQCVIEYDGLYYWCGVDRFLVYNGVVQEIPNDKNMNYFFDNLNYEQRQKVWVAKIPRWGEIWWFYPKGDSVECNDAIIYNIREKTWYDGGQATGTQRSSGTFSEVFRFPVWAGNEPNIAGAYTVWQHEVGVDEVYLGNVNAIESSFETNSLGWVNGGPGTKQVKGLNRWIRVERIEPDFVQSEQMEIIVTGKSYADDVNQVSDPYYFDPDTLKVDMREQRREMRLKFTSNTVRGNYQLGNVLISADIGDERGTGNP